MSLIRTKVLQHLAQQVQDQNSSFRWVDIYAAEFIVKGLFGDEQKYGNELAYLVCTLSYRTSKGDVSLVLSELKKSLKLGLLPCMLSPQNFEELLESQLEALSVVANESSLNSEMALVKTVKPLVLFDGKLHLSRFWNLQVEFSSWLERRIKISTALGQSEISTLSVQLKNLFRLTAETSNDQLDWQAISAAHALLQRTTFIAGGPGTGKTTTAASLLFLLDQSMRMQKGRTAKVSLLAPTGKAAVRLADSIKFQIKRIESEQLSGKQDGLYLSEVLPDYGETIHRYLNAHQALPSQHAGTENLTAESLLLGKRAARQTSADILIVDESSMIDLALMVALISTVPDLTQVIFMGDPYQLPPVEPGEVFANCVQRFSRDSYSAAFAQGISSLTGYDPHRLAPKDGKASLDNSAGISVPLCYLRKTYRFGGDLKQASGLINAGRFSEFKTRFRVKNIVETRDRDVVWLEMIQGGDEAEQAALSKQVTESYQTYFDLVKENAGLDQLNKKFAEFQLLCSTHEGEHGVTAMNNLIESSLIESHPDLKLGAIDPATFLYHGKAILITKNHTDLGVFNGDIGFVIREKQSAAAGNKFTVMVPQGSGNAIQVSPKRLKAWQPAYAMTVHKSQGSEYQHVGLLLADYAKELLSRSLLYTGLTRAKQGCVIWAHNDALERAFLS